MDEKNDLIIYLELIKNCKRVNIKCGHDIHYLKPKVFYKAVEQLRKIIG